VDAWTVLCAHPSGADSRHRQRDGQRTGANALPVQTIRPNSTSTHLIGVRNSVKNPACCQAQGRVVTSISYLLWAPCSPAWAGMRTTHYTVYLSIVLGPRCAIYDLHARALLQTLTQMDMSARGTGELDHVRERVGRPSLAFVRPILSEQRREQHAPILSLSHRLDRRSSVCDL
jgi:hypothetical protein